MSPRSNRKSAFGQRSTSKNTWPRWVVNLSPRYGHVILDSGYLVLTGANWLWHGCPILKKYTVNQRCMSLSTYYLEYGSHLARLHRRRRRRCAYAPTSKTASNDNHEKINSLVSFCFPYEYGAPLVRRLGPPELRSGTHKLHVEAFVCQMILLVDRSYIHVALTWVSLQLY